MRQGTAGYISTTEGEKFHAMIEFLTSFSLQNGSHSMGTSHGRISSIALQEAERSEVEGNSTSCRSRRKLMMDQMLAERHSLGDASISSIEIGWNSIKKRSPLDYLAERRLSISGSSCVSRSTDWDSRFEFEPTR